MHDENIYLFYRKSNRGLFAFWRKYQLGNLGCVWLGMKCSSLLVWIFLFGLFYNLLPLLAHSSDFWAFKCFLSAVSQAPLLFSWLLIIQLEMCCCFLLLWQQNDINFEEKCLPLNCLQKTPVFLTQHSLQTSIDITEHENLGRNKGLHLLMSWQVDDI